LLTAEPIWTRPEQVVVEFLAAPVNPLDFLVIHGKYPIKPQTTIVFTKHRMRSPCAFAVGPKNNEIINGQVAHGGADSTWPLMISLFFGPTAKAHGERMRCLVKTISFVFRHHTAGLVG
jgi:hypothetical protein